MRSLHWILLALEQPCALLRINAECNEGTKVQNPRRLCHVQCIRNYNIHEYYTRQYAHVYADKCVSVRGSIRTFGKDKSSCLR